RFNQLTYINTMVSVRAGESDVVVGRLDAKSLDPKHCRELLLPEYTPGQMAQFTTACILCLRDQYGLDNVLRHALDPAVIAHSQKEVMSERRAPSYY
ncbi:MAG: hypothetical protein AB7V55_06290, partial [Oscillospiraceae bacterium]